MLKHFLSINFYTFYMHALIKMYIFSFSDMLNFIHFITRSSVHLLIHSQIHSSRPMFERRPCVVTWLSTGQWLASWVNWVFFEVTEQVFREWCWCTHLYERVYTCKCVHELISGNFTRLARVRLGSQSKYRVILIPPYNSSNLY